MSRYLKSTIARTIVAIGGTFKSKSGKRKRVMCDTPVSVKIQHWTNILFNMPADDFLIICDAVDIVKDMRDNND
jgi:hypothetical protein